MMKLATDMCPQHIHIVEEHEQGLRLDVMLSFLEEIPSRNAAARLIDAGKVTVNTAPGIRKHVVSVGDEVSFYIDDSPVFSLDAEDIPLDVRYEDEGFLIISKQAGLICHPSPGHRESTLVNALVNHCGYEHLAKLQGDDRPGIVHRLDGDTSGLMLAAKTTEVGLTLQDGIRTRNIDRRYLTLVHGFIAPDTGMIDAPLVRDGRDRLRMCVSDRNGARSAVTTFSVLERFEASAFDEGYTLLECKLYSGRTHQIRVHMLYIGHPVVGDQTYGKFSDKVNRGLRRQFLHSFRLDLSHPVTGVSMEFMDHLPDDLDQVLRGIKDRSMGRTLYGEEILSEIGY
jgi:23S rRNA pseudouridine1911/1915/1917 synthase